MRKTIEKYSPGTVVAGLAVMTAGTLASHYVESDAAASEAAAISQCTEDYQNNLLSDSQRKDCVESAEEANNIEGLTDALQAAGFVGIAILGVGTVAVVYDGVIREKTVIDEPRAEHTEIDDD